MSHLLTQIQQYDAFLSDARARHEALGREIADKQRAHDALVSAASEYERRKLGITETPAKALPATPAKQPKPQSVSRRE